MSFVYVTDLKSLIQSAVSQQEENKHPILTHICRIWENGTDEPICRTAIETQTQRLDLRTQQGKERVGQNERVGLT